MITLEPKQFVNELQDAALTVFSMGFYCGLSIGLFIAFFVFIKYYPDNLERVSTSDSGNQNSETSSL